MTIDREIKDLAKGLNGCRLSSCRFGQERSRMISFDGSDSRSLNSAISACLLYSNFRSTYSCTLIYLHTNSSTDYNQFMYLIRGCLLHASTNIMKRMNHLHSHENSQEARVSNRPLFQTYSLLQSFQKAASTPNEWMKWL